MSAEDDLFDPPLNAELVIRKLEEASRLCFDHHPARAMLRIREVIAILKARAK